MCKPIPTPVNIWTGNNIGRFFGPAYDALAARLSATGPLAERAAIVKTMNDMLVERAGLVPVVHRANVSSRAKSLSAVAMNA